MKPIRRGEKKPSRELEVFKGFRNNYPEMFLNPQANDPPKPDITCQLRNGLRVDFELSEVWDKSMAQATNFAFKKKGSQGGGIKAGAFADPVIETIDKKFGKRYDTDNEVRLLVYYDLQPHFLFESFIPEIEGFIDENIHDSQINQVYIYSFAENRVLYHYPSRY